VFLENDGREHARFVSGLFWAVFLGIILALELQRRINILEDQN